MTEEKIIKAWHSVTDEWIVRYNKEHEDGCVHEVLHDWGGDLISDDTQEIVGRFADRREAERLSQNLENEARARAVLELIKTEQ